ncbi:MAG: GH92 family glycosyl hydrolase, partial [Crocinitomicaceae bacterium]
TRLTGWDGCSGYHYSDSILYGFSHTHLSGTGVSDYGDLLIMPFDPNTVRKDAEGQIISSFSHQKEKATPGYYAVHLNDGDIDAEFTVSERAGMHHYTFNENQPTVVIDLNHRDELLGYEIAAVSSTKLVGKRISKAWAEEQHFYFTIEFSQPFKITSTELEGKRLFLSFSESNELYVKVGMSAVDVGGAKQNLLEEIPSWDFNAIREKVKSAWNKELHKIEVFTTDTNFLTTYYTALYHSFLNPNLFTDVDGRYRGMDLKIHQTTDDQYTVFSLWDTFRALHPLFTLTQQKRTAAFVRTFLRQYQDGGKLPVWELSANETECMIGYHAVSVIADAYAKGIQDFDTKLAIEAMVSISKQDELGKKAFHTLGFIPVEEEHESISKALEYAYDDWCIASLAKSLGKDSIANEYFQYAQFYKNCFNPNNGFMQAKIYNSFQEPFNPREVNFNYTEANAWQYSFFVPQDIYHWIDLIGGDKKVEEKLDELFSTTSQTTGRDQVDISGLIGQYAHGNEPSHHIAYLYNYVGKPSKTQEKTEEIIRTMYANAPDGLSGNEDCGQMSAWLNLSALGLYQVTPGLPIYNLTVPHLDSATINLENGKKFQITTQGRTSGQNYIQKVILNGVEWNNSYINHEAINNGGKLIFILGNTSNNWATDKESRPYSSIDAPEISIVPYFKAQKHTFEKSIELELCKVSPIQQLFYTIDGSDPTEQSIRYEGPILINKTSRIKTLATENGVKSPTITQTYFYVPQKWDISIQSHCSEQYSAGGSGALIDHQKGGNDFRTGAWQGYQGENFKAVVDLTKVKKICKVGANFIQDINSWIWMPKRLLVWSSKDSIHWKSIAVISPTIPSDRYGNEVEELSCKLTKSVKARYIKFEAEQFGEIPSWHLGAGGESFIFIDELLISDTKDCLK